MSKQPKRKITVDLGSKPPEAARPSVFERLGTKKAASKKTGGGEREHCRQWAAHGVCAYGKGCKFASTHTLVSPSKARAASKDDSGGGARLHSAVVRADELDTWDQNDLEYADTDVLEKRRQQLQRELELQLKMDSGKTERKTKKKPPSSSSSSRSSSSSSASTSTTGGSSTSSSSERDRKKGKKVKGKRNSSSSSDDSPSKKKKFGKDSGPRSKSSTSKKIAVKKDDRLVKKHETTSTKKKVLLKMTLTRKKSLSPGKKASGTPPIKGLAKNYRKHSKSPVRRDKNRSISPTSAKEKERERQRERDREREKDRDRGRKSRSVQRKARSRSPRRSHPKEQRRKDSPERSRPISPKKARRDQSSDKHGKSLTRDRDRRDHKEKSLDRRKDEKDRHEREKLVARQRERPKDTKRDTVKRGRDRREADRGLEKPSKPMERLLPRPEERLAALAAISNRNLEDKSSTNSKDRQDLERGRKQDRMERDRRERSSKRDRMSMERDHGDYDRGLDRGYDRGHSMDRNYDRVGERYDDGPREGDNRSPGYGRERHYDPGYEIPGHPRYSDPEERGYGEHMGDHRGVDMGFDERRRREHSWEGSGSLERERAYHGHQHKEWEGEEFHSGAEWGRERHWQHRDPQMGEWAEKEAEMEPGWHHRGHPPPAPHRSRMHDEGYGRNMRMEQHSREPMPGKRRSGQQRTEPAPAPSPGVKPEPSSAPAQADPTPVDGEEMPVPDDLSEISDDPDDILNRDDMMERGDDNTQLERQPSEERAVRAERAVKTELQNDTYANNAQELAAAGSPAGAKAESQDGNDEDIKELDFEEISDGELEEERARAGLGDALGVDWASLVAEVRRSKEPGPPSGAQRRWQPAGVLARVGVSVAMAGAPMAADVIAESRGDSNQPPVHPVASIQVAMERRKRQRAALFGTGCDVTRALSARRDLALRRHLCSLPPVERSGHGRGSTQPHLFHAARTLLMQSG